MKPTHPEGCMPSDLLSALQAHADARPYDTALVFLHDGDEDAESWSWAQLLDEVRAVAARMQAEVAPGARVLLLYPQGLPFVAALLGCMAAGVLAVPLQPPGRHRARLALAKLDAIGADGGLAAVLTVDALASELRAVLAESATLAGLPWVCTDDLPRAPEAWVLTPPAPDAVAYLQYTSGSTSTPKGVMVTHANLATNLHTFDVDFGHDAQSVMVSWLPTFHDLGLVYGVFLPLWKGFPTVLLDPLHFLQRPSRWPAAVHRFRGTHSAAPNFAFELVAERSTPEERAGWDLSCWKVALNGAEPIRHASEAAFVDALAGCGVRWTTIKHAYGMSESTAVISKEPVGSEPVFFDVDGAAFEQHTVRFVAPDAPGARRVAGCGAVTPPTVVRIVDPDTLAVCAPDRVGEIWVGGPTRARGYWQLPEESAAAFEAHTSDTGEGPFLRTGDLGFVADGQVVVTGRHKDLLIVRGENHYPQDLELAAERAHPAVRPSCSAAFALDHHGVEAVGIAVEVYPERVTDPEAVLAALRDAVAEEGVQARVVVLLPARAIPKTSSGKIMRRRTREGVLDGSIPVLARWEAQDERVLETQDLAGRLAATAAADREDLLAAHVLVRAAALLGFDDPSALDDEAPLRELGFDSVQIVDLTEQLGQDLGRQLPATLLFDVPSARALARHLVAQPAAGATAAPAKPAEDLDALDEAELAALLQAELDDLD